MIAIGNTLKFAIITGPIGFFLSFMFAWLINPLKLKTPLALCFYAPSITGAVAMGVVWKIVFSGDRYGYLNNWLLGIGAIDEPYMFLAEQAAIMPVIMFVALWMSMGTGFLVFLAGLQTVPTDLYEAGKMDGIKNPLQEVWYITLPMIKPQLELKPLRKQAAREGMVPLRLSGLMKVAEGLTTLDEVLKATPPWNH